MNIFFHVSSSSPFDHLPSPLSPIQDYILLDEYINNIFFMEDLPPLHKKNSNPPSVIVDGSSISYIQSNPETTFFSKVDSDTSNPLFQVTPLGRTKTNDCINIHSIFFCFWPAQYSLQNDNLKEGC